MQDLKNIQKGSIRNYIFNIEDLTPYSKHKDIVASNGPNALLPSIQTFKEHIEDEIDQQEVVIKSILLNIKHNPFLNVHGLLVMNSNR